MKKKAASKATFEAVRIEKAVITAETITVRDLSERIGKPAGEIIKKLFMQGKIGFMDIPRLVQLALEADWPQKGDVQTVLETDRAARELVLSRA